MKKTIWLPAALVTITLFGTSVAAQAQAPDADLKINKSKFDHWGKPLDNQNCKITKTFVDPKWPGDIVMDLLEIDNYPPEKQGHIRGRTHRGGLGERWILCQFDLPEPIQEFEFITSGTVVHFSTWDGTSGSGGLAVYFYDHLPQVDWGKPGDFHKGIERYNVYGQHSVNFEGGVHKFELKSPSKVLAIGVRLRDAWRDTIVDFDMEWSYIRQFKKK
jgi:hypothetical protein